MRRAILALAALALVGCTAGPATTAQALPNVSCSTHGLPAHLSPQGGHVEDVYQSVQDTHWKAYALDVHRFGIRGSNLGTTRVVPNRYGAGSVKVSTATKAVSLTARWRSGTATISCTTPRTAP